MSAAVLFSDIVTYGPMVIGAASAAAAVLPQTGPGWWVWTRKAIDVLAINVGNAKNQPKP